MQNRTHLIAALAAALALVFTASPATAKPRPVNEGGDYRPCVTYEEFLAANLGMPMHRVQRIFDTNGTRASAITTGGFTDLYGSTDRSGIVRLYPSCEDGTQVIVEFGPRRQRMAGSYWGP